MKNIILFSIFALFSSSHTLQLPAQENVVLNKNKTDTELDDVKETDETSSQTEKVQFEELPVWKEKNLSEVINSEEAILTEEVVDDKTASEAVKSKDTSSKSKENITSSKRSKTETDNKISTNNKNDDNNDYVKYYSIQSQMLEQSALEDSPAPITKTDKTENSKDNIISNKEDSKREKTEEAELGIVPSKNIELPVYRLFHVTYPSRDWTYLGEVRTETSEKNKKLVSYISESTNGNQTSFTLRTNHTGNSLLHFYKNDKLTGENIDDYISVSITGTEIAIAETENTKDDEKLESSSINSAPTLTEDAVITEDTSYGNNLISTENNSTASEKTQEKRIISQHEETVDPTSFSIRNRIVEVDNPEETDELLQKAQDSYNNKNYAEAKSLIDSFFTSAITHLDQGLYLQGLILEASSPIQNMRGALKSYQNIIDNYPSSSYAKAAKEKTIYLERFYFDIR